MKTGIAFLAAIALAIVLSADASPRSDGLSLTSGDSLSKVWNNVFSHSKAVGSGSDDPDSDFEDKNPVVIIEYAVPPPVGKRFLEVFQYLNAAVSRLDSVKTFGLARTIDDNLSYYLYSQFNGTEAYHEHEASEVFSKFVEAVDQLGVVYKVYPIQKISANVSVNGKLSKAWNSDIVNKVFKHTSTAAINDDEYDEEDKEPVALIDFAVPPPVSEQFVQLFYNLETQVAEVDGVESYGFGRPVGNNLGYYLYSQFSSRNAYRSYRHSLPLKEFQKAISKIGVVYKTHPLKPITYEV